MNFDPMKPPKASFHKEWLVERAKRTHEVCEKQKTIDGKQIREQLLAMSIIVEHGFKFNKRFDRMEKHGE
jgi:hypothetical protein